MKKIKVILVALLMFGTAQAQVEVDLFNGYIAQGMGDMKGFNYFGMSSEFGYRFPNTPIMINGFYSGGTYNYRTEYLPMYSESHGYTEQVTAENNGGIRSMGMRLRIASAPQKDRLFFPYLELGGGHARYQQNWTTQGLTPGSYEPDEYCPKNYESRGSINRNGTFFVSSEVGFMIQYPGFKNEIGKGVYFGFSVRHEIGGLVEYAQVNKNPQHFYYESGLGEEFDRPFANQTVVKGRGEINKARHHQLMYKLTLFRLVL